MTRRRTWSAPSAMSRGTGPAATGPCPSVGAPYPLDGSRRRVRRRHRPGRATVLAAPGPVPVGGVGLLLAASLTGGTASRPSGRAGQQVASAPAVRSHGYRPCAAFTGAQRSARPSRILLARLSSRWASGAPSVDSAAVAVPAPSGRTGAAPSARARRRGAGDRASGASAVKHGRGRRLRRPARPKPRSGAPRPVDAAPVLVAATSAIVLRDPDQRCSSGHRRRPGSARRAGRGRGHLPR